MQTIREQKMADKLPVRLTSTYSTDQNLLIQVKNAKIREYKSWSACFAIISGLTGLMKWLKIGITMDSINSILFFSSIAGLIYFVSRIYLLLKNPARSGSKSLHELN
jgi:hypothetical protein